jgi:anti-sigma factor RsiW
MGCPDHTTLEQLARGELPEAEMAGVQAHSETCRRCAKQLAALPIDDDLIAEVRELEVSREAIAPALSMLPEIERHLTTHWQRDAGV